MLNSGNRSRKLAVSATNMESSSPLAATQIEKEEIFGHQRAGVRKFILFQFDSLSGLSRHTNLLLTQANDDMLTNPTPTKLILHETDGTRRCPQVEFVSRGLLLLCYPREWLSNFKDC